MGGSVSAGDDHSHSIDRRPARGAATGTDEQTIMTTIFDMDVPTTVPKAAPPIVPEKKVPAEQTPLKIRVKDFDFYYGSAKVLHGITLDIPERQVTALIGPSGCGKSTFIRSINRMNDIIIDARADGTIEIDGRNI